MNVSASINVMLADDHDLVRAAMRMLLESFKDVHIVAEVGKIAEILPAVLEHKPDILLLDLGFPDGSGVETAKVVLEQAPDTRVLVFSMYAKEEYVRDTLKLGVSGYLLKESAASELEISIRAVAAGEIYLSPAISRQVVKGYVSKDEQTEKEDLLTPRQNEILRCVASGQSSKQVARELGISIKTVEAHRAEIMRRLQVHDVSGMVRYAIRTGLISATD
ncbi:MAG: response regulator [Gammaproteobacteria bacterium]